MFTNTLTSSYVYRLNLESSTSLHQYLRRVNPSGFTAPSHIILGKPLAPLGEGAAIPYRLREESRVRGSSEITIATNYGGHHTTLGWKLSFALDFPPAASRSGGLNNLPNPLEQIPFYQFPRKIAFIEAVNSAQRRFHHGIH
jgi:hypothetical protein